MTQPKIEIYDIMACNVYWDFENTGLEKEQHKFLVSFFPTGGAPIPELVESITAHGPDGYKVEFKNETFTGKNLNGHIYDRTTNAHWYMVNLATGFMKEREYTIEVKCKDGSVRSKSRMQLDAPGKAIVSAYEKNRQRIYDSFSPSAQSPLPANSPLKNVTVKWSPLRELAGQDAYYIYRVSEAKSSKEFNTQHLTWWDNIFVQRFSNPTAGLNRDRVVIDTQLNANSHYTYFVEITDGNQMGGTNICIFQPYRTFAT